LVCALVAWVEGVIDDEGDIVEGGTGEVEKSTADAEIFACFKSALSDLWGTLGTAGIESKVDLVLVRSSSNRVPGWRSLLDRK